MSATLSFHGLRYLLLCLGLLLGGCGVQSVFYHPDHVLYSTPADLGLRFEAVSFHSQDGTPLIGWFIPAAGYANPRDAKGTVVHFHGNAQNMTAHWQYVAWLPRRGYNVLAFDYRGYGASQGEPEVKGVFEDSRSALDYVRTRKDVNPGRLLVLGQSLGGTNAIAAVGSGNRVGVRAVAIEATFYSYSRIASDKVSGAGLLMNDSYSAANFVDRLAPLPLLLIHGTADPVIPYAHAVQLLDKAQEPKRLITVPGGGHIEAFTPRFGSTYQDVVVDFFDAALGLGPAKP
ncbi:alpha/beta hydrolase [Rhodoferax saidenbachensis]|uniref:Fermentation-respiration switch protein FrsA (DUF1100 family) n=1 Tax=Rhodoferax saidenbachensis TaxID=1484693 RepID=A0ABU1ZLI4_9BURK|nr:alpha/beta hydrolase [Rhodoferax saidenbachensis]MDR7306243.1 fermentation-respiration switch protein FrsA (DUF1100 family) [Rhodoferax saidenbachensis]